jgi:hypothetical protein
MEAVGEGLEVESAVAVSSCVAVNIREAVGVGVSVAMGVWVDNKMGLAVGDRICPTTGSPQKAAAPLKEARTSAAVNHCQPASIRACRVR